MLEVLELKLSRLRNELLKDERADLNDEVLVLLTGETEPPEMRRGVLPPLLSPSRGAGTMTVSSKSSSSTSSRRRVRLEEMKGPREACSMKPASSR